MFRNMKSGLAGLALSGAAAGMLLEGCGPVATIIAAETIADGHRDAARIANGGSQSREINAPNEDPIAGPYTNTTYGNEFGEIYLFSSYMSWIGEKGSSVIIPYQNILNIYADEGLGRDDLDITTRTKKYKFGPYHGHKTESEIVPLIKRRMAAN